MNEPVIRIDQIEPFIKATIETFKTMVHLKVIHGEIRVRKPSEPASDYSGIIGLTGGAEGSVTLGFPLGTAKAVASSFLGEETVSESLVADTIGEIANIITGYAKKDIPGVEINISLPTVIKGASHEIISHADDKKIITFFVCPLGEFSLEVYLEGLPGQFPTQSGPGEA
ncbi:MAG TPA: chemotaxis protein CheX [Fibrobacteria bacterium]|nr:chemotaxis protein CheX [Fibrobacteria bacterium]